MKVQYKDNIMEAKVSLHGGFLRSCLLCAPSCLQLFSSRAASSLFLCCALQHCSRAARPRTIEVQHITSHRPSPICVVIYHTLLEVPLLSDTLSHNKTYGPSLDQTKNGRDNCPVTLVFYYQQDRAGPPPRRS